MTNASFDAQVEWNNQRHAKAAGGLWSGLASLSVRKARTMDEDDRKLIVRLCTRAGMMMEDASAVAIGTAELREPELSDVVRELATVASNIQKIVSAAEVLVKS